MIRFCFKFHFTQLSRFIDSFSAGTIGHAKYLVFSS